MWMLIKQHYYSSDLLLCECCKPFFFKLIHTFFFRLTSTTVCVLFSPFKFYIFFLSILLFPALSLLVITVVLFEILIFSCNFCSHWNEWQTSHKTVKLAWFWSLTISTYFHLQPSFQLSNVLHSNSALSVVLQWIFNFCMNYEDLYGLISLL